MALLPGKTKAAPFGAQTLFATRSPEKHANYLLPYLKAGDYILDLGCGPGSITHGFARLVPQGHVLGLDFNAPGLEGARKIAKEEGLTNVEFVEGDAHDVFEILKQYEGKLDVVHSHMCIMYLRHPVDVLKQVRRLLKPGGILAIRDSCQIIRASQDDSDDKEEREFFEKIMAKRGGNLKAGLENDRWANEAGWSWDQIQWGTESWSFSGEEGRRLWYQGVRDVMRKSAMQGGFATEEQVDEYEARYARWLEDPSGKMIGLDGWVLAWK